MKNIVFLFFLVQLMSCSSSQTNTEQAHSATREQVSSGQDSFNKRYADNLLESIPYSSHCSVYRSGIKSIVAEHISSYKKERKINTILKSANEANCVK